MRVSVCPLIAAMATFLVAVPSGAVHLPDSSRPKIGLALGGGAAKGFAHIGVLRWLEENRIPVDCIAGTSMGAVVGCAYSMGMTPDEIERLFEGVDWSAMFESEAPFEAMDFRRKEDEREYPTGIQIGLRGGVRLPSGLIGGQSIRLLLNKTTLPYGGLTEFDRLPVPFRCVAVDIERGEKVVLSEGSLSAAVRASMAIPGVFTPEEIGGRLLVDGGVLDNVPADVAREMGADIVIAVDVGAGLRDRSELDSLVGMLGQSLTAMMRVQTEAMLRTADIVIAPDVSAGFASDYRQFAQIAELGYAAAEARARVLRPFALDEASWVEMMERRKASIRRDPVIAGHVVVQGTDPRSAESIASRLSPMVGVPLEPEMLESQLTRIYGSGRYSSIGYEVVGEGEDSTLVISARRKTHGPPFLHTALQISATRVNDMRFSLGGRVTYLDAFRQGGEVRLDVGLGVNSGVSAEWYIPVGGGGHFVAPAAFYNKVSQDVFDGGVQVGKFNEREAGIGLDWGYSVGLNAEARLGLQLSNLLASSGAGVAVLPREEGAVRRARLRMIYDGQDHPLIPSSGTRAALEASWYFRSPGESDAFGQAELTVSSFRPFTPTERGFVLLAGGTTFSETAPASRQFLMGGPMRLSAYGAGEFRGSHYLLASSGLIRRVKATPGYFGGTSYVIAWLEYGSAFEDRSDAEFLADISGGLLMETLFGPVFLGGSLGEQGRATAYLSVGRIF